MQIQRHSIKDKKILSRIIQGENTRARGKEERESEQKTGADERKTEDLEEESEPRTA